MIVVTIFFWFSIKRNREPHAENLIFVSFQYFYLAGSSKLATCILPIHSDNYSLIFLIIVIIFSDNNWKEHERYWYISLWLWAKINNSVAFIIKKKISSRFFFNSKLKYSSLSVLSYLYTKISNWLIVINNINSN